MPKVDISDYEKKKKKSRRTVFKYRPKTNKIDKTLKKVSDSLDKDIYITSGDRSPKSKASRKNHSGQRARDIGIRSNPQLTKEDRDNISAQAALDGLRVGTDDRHLHLDSRAKERKVRIFTEDGNKKNSSYKRAKIADDDRRNLYSKAKDKPKKKIEKLSLKQKLEQLSKIDPQGSNKKENIEAVLENNPDKLVPQMTEETPRLAMRQDQDGTLLEKMRRVSKGPNRDIDTSREERAESTQEIVQSGQARQKEAGERLIASQPEAVSEVVKNLPDLDEKTAKDVGKDIQAKAQGKQRAGGPTSQFTEALTFFLPQVIGGLAGAAFEGTEGAIAGIQESGKARDAFLKHKMEKERLASTTGKSDLDRRKVEIAEANLGLRGKKLDLDKGAETRRTKQLDLNTKKFGLTEKQAGQLSGKQVDQLKDMNNVGLSIDRIEELRQEVNTGPLAGRVQSMAQWADAAPESFNKMKAQTASTLSNYVKSISGAQVAEAEAIRLQAVIPSVNDAPGVFKSKLDEFKKIVDMNKKAFAQAITTGQPLKAGAVIGLLEAEKKFAKKNKEEGKSGFSREDIDAMKARIRAERK